MNSPFNEPGACLAGQELGVEREAARLPLGQLALQDLPLVELDMLHGSPAQSVGLSSEWAQAHWLQLRVLEGSLVGDVEDLGQDFSVHVPND